MSETGAEDLAIVASPLRYLKLTLLLKEVHFESLTQTSSQQFTKLCITQLLMNWQFLEALGHEHHTEVGIYDAVTPYASKIPIHPNGSK